MFPCRDCPQQYIGETSKKVETRLTEHRNAIKRHDPKSLPANSCRRLRTLLQLVTNRNTRTSSNTPRLQIQGSLAQHGQIHPSTDTSIFPPSTINSNKLKTLDSHHYLRRLELTLQTFETPQQLENPQLELPIQQPILKRRERMTRTPLTLNQSDTPRDWNRRDA